MESSFFRIIVSTVGLFPFMDSVFATPVTFDNAHNDKYKQEERNC